MHRLDTRQSSLLQAEARGIVGMDLHERLGDVACEARRQRRACHGVPLVANAAGVEHEWPGVGDLVGDAGGLDGNEPGLPIRRKEFSLGKQPSASALPIAERPLEGLEAVIGSLAES